MARRSARGPAWERLRAAVFERASHRCEEEGCGSPATEVHHLDGVAADPLPPIERLIGVCQECHLAKHGKKRRGISPAWRAAVAALEGGRA